MDSVHHIWCPLFSQEFQDLPDGAETTLTVKEAEAWKIQIRGGAATESDWVRAGGRNPDDVKRRRKAEIDENRKLDLVFDTDPASDKGGSSAATKRQEPQHTDDQSEE
ncbi:hypothetical protein HVK88_002476 [Escherichia coli]|nr:hypothetical protein [Escherichia coli]